MLFSLTKRSFTKNIGKNISKILSSKYSQKRLDHAKQSATDALKSYSKRVIQETVEGTCNLTGNKIVLKQSEKLCHRMI